jgi:hypothetical protein
MPEPRAGRVKSLFLNADTCIVCNVWSLDENKHKDGYRHCPSLHGDVVDTCL